MSDNSLPFDSADIQPDADFFAGYDEFSDALANALPPVVEECAYCGDLATQTLDVCEACWADVTGATSPAAVRFDSFSAMMRDAEGQP